MHLHRLILIFLFYPLLLSAQPWDEGRQPKVQYLLNDDFSDDRAAGAVNGTYAFPGPGLRTVTDTESKLSLSGGNLVFSGGNASPGWSDPSIEESSFTPQDGAILCAGVNILATDAYMGFGLARINFTSAYLFEFSNTGLIGTASAFGSAFKSIGSYSTGNYKFAITTFNTPTANNRDAFFFVKGGAYSQYTLVYMLQQTVVGPLAPSVRNYSSTNTFDYLRVPTSTFIPAPLLSDSFTRANGAIGSTDGLGHQEKNGGGGLAWSGSTWGILGNAATNAPGVGGELLLNPDLEAPYLASGVATNWSKSGTPTPTEETTIVYSGSSSQKMVSSADNEYVYQKPTTVIGSWYMMSGWGYEATGDASSTLSIGHLYLPSGNGTKSISPNSTWTQFISTGRANRTDAYIRLLHTTTTSSTGYLDDCSIKQLNLTNCLSLSPALSTPNVIIDCSFIRGTTGFQTGIAACWDDTTYTNGILCYYDGNGVVNVDGVVNGLYTNLITGAITYSDGAPLRLVCNPSGNELRAYYNNAAVGTPKTTGVWPGWTNFTKIGKFITWTNPCITNIVVRARGNEGQYNILDKY